MHNKKYLLLICTLLGISNTSISAYNIEINNTEKTYQVATIFADTSYSTQKIVEVDMQGNIIWEYLKPNSLYQGKSGKRYGLNDVELLNNGNILFNIQLVGAYEINRLGDIVWQHLDSQMSHDVDRLENGNTLYTQGWVDKGEDHVVEVDRNGNMVWSWNGLKQYNKKPFSKINRGGWIHANSVTRMKNGNTVVSLRNFNRLVELNNNGDIVNERFFGGVKGKKLKKKLGPHDPEILPNKNILVPLTAVNKVIEIKPGMGKVWQYSHPKGKKPSVSIRDANRLPNGNTLLTQYNSIIELDKHNNVVWKLTIPTINRSKKDHYKYLYKAIRK